MKLTPAQLKEAYHLQKVALGRRGGTARWANTTLEERRDHAIKMRKQVGKKDKLNLENEEKIQE